MYLCETCLESGLANKSFLHLLVLLFSTCFGWSNLRFSNIRMKQMIDGLSSKKKVRVKDTAVT